MEPSICELDVGFVSIVIVDNIFPPWSSDVTCFQPILNMLFPCLVSLYPYKSHGDDKTDKSKCLKLQNPNQTKSLMKSKSKPVSSKYSPYDLQRLLGNLRLGNIFVDMFHFLFRPIHR